MQVQTFRRRGGCALFAAVLVAVSSPSFASDFTWSGATDTAWATGTNWGGTAPVDDLTTDVAVFNSAFTNQPNSGLRSISGLRVGAGRTTAFTIATGTTGTGLSLGGNGIDMSSAGNYTVTLGTNSTNLITVAAPQTWTVSSTSQLTVAGVIAINNLVTLNGAGTTRFSAANTGAGGVTSNSGTLVINNPAGIGTGTLTIGGGSLNSSGVLLGTNNPQVWNGDFTFLATGALNMGTGAVTMNGSRQITVNGTTNALTVGGNVTGGSIGTLTKAGTGQLVLAGTNAFTGVIIRGGLVEAQRLTTGVTSLGTGNVTLGDSTGSANATLQLQGSGATFSNPLILGGTTGTLTLSTRNNSTAVNWNGGVTGTGNLTLNNGVNNNSQPLNFGTAAINFTGTLTNATTGSGVGGVVITSTIGSNVTGVVQNSSIGPMTLSGNNTYTSATTVTLGALYANALSGSSTGTGPVNVGAAGILGGTGIVGGLVTVTGAVSPGPVAGGISTLRLSANSTALTFANDSTYRFQTGNGSTADLINLTGTNSTVAFGSTWNLNITAASGDPTGDTFTLIDYTSAIDPVLPSTINFTGAYQGVVAVDATNHAIVISNVTAVVPEPATLGVGALVAGGLLLRRRRSTAR